MNTKLLSPKQKMIILEGLSNNKEYFEGILLSELDRLESIIKNYELVCNLVNDKMNDASCKLPVDIHTLKEKNKIRAKK